MGAATKLCAGNTAWPASVAGKAVWATAPPQAKVAARATREREAKRVMNEKAFSRKRETLPARRDATMTSAQENDSCGLFTINQNTTAIATKAG
ncbi:hypothetical protein FQZ97_1079730 [compost metagenome]